MWPQLLTAMLVLLFVSPLTAGEAIMRSGFKIEFEGKPEPVQGLTLDLIRRGSSGPITSYPFTKFEDGPRITYLPQAQVQEVQLGSPHVEEFSISIPPGSRTMAFGSLGGYRVIKPFSDFGRRIIALNTPQGEMEVIQAISTLRPDYVTLKALKQNWEYSVTTQDIPPEVLRSTLSVSINEKNPNDRLAIVRFFIDADMLMQAQQELDRIEKEGQFPDFANRINELRLLIRQLQALEFLNEFKTRLAAGQFELVYQKAHQFPRQDINQATLQEVDRIISDHEAAYEQMDRIRAELSRLQAEVKSPQQLVRFQDMRSVIDKRLSRHNLEKLTPFVQNLDDQFLTAEQKLALAYSGWIVGPALAETDADTAISYWDARDAVRSYLQVTNPIRKQEIYHSLSQIEGIGPDILAAIVQNMGPAYETPASEMGVPFTLNTMNVGKSYGYQVLLPLGYSADRSYPLVMALPSAGVPAQAEVAWWGGSSLGGPAHRNGYIVISPEWPAEEISGSSAVHEIVLDILRDSRKRLAIDSDHVFLAGHGTGASAALDVGMSHPSEFAGLISIGGRFNEYAHHYWKNCDALPTYFVVGELDGDLYNANSSDWTRMMKYGQDVVLTQYKQRGGEDYRDELPRILDWMKLHIRELPPLEFERITMRSGDNRFDWFEFSGLPEATLNPRVSPGGRLIPATALPVEATITPGNNIYVKVAANRITLWLTPELVDFTERVKIRWKGRTQFNDFPEPNGETMLQHLDFTGDRKRLYWMRVDL
ncbi:hypothetical protein [uncultured Rubinisphaera sp.]|uniref:carboxylesterase family protein n=1 Tax=uncultured Rubinisphaera sp. TaxID=1678686 RepID=UPI0030D7C8D6